MNLKQFSSCSNEHDSWYNSATLFFLWTQQQSILTDRKTYQHHQAFYVTLNVKGIVGYTVRICSATVSSRNKVFIIYEYLSETSGERTVIVSASPLHNNLMTFFENFRQKNLTPSLLYSRFVLNWRLNVVKYNCVLEIWVVIDCALVIFTSRFNGNVLFKRRRFRFHVVGNLSLK